MTKAFNLDLLEFVDFPLEESLYEVYIKRAGYESNRMQFKVVFIEE